MAIPKRSPWGAVQHSEVLGTGVVGVSTAGHGGIKLDATRNKKVHPAWRNDDGWYEEDIEAEIVAWTFIELFPNASRDRVAAALKNWLPREYAAVTGEVVSMEDSFILRKEKFDEENKAKYVVRAAWGEWHENVPFGKVGVVARRESNGDEKYLLVDADEYQARNHQYVCQGTELDWIGPDA
jgi:hypothetical protein